MAEELRRLHRLAGDVSTLSRTEEQRLDLQLAVADLAELASSVVERLRPQFDDAGVALVLRAGTAVPVRVDVDRISQVVTNLLGKALLATPSGGQLRVVIGRTGKSGCAAGPVLLWLSGPGRGQRTLRRAGPSSGRPQDQHQLVDGVGGIAKVRLRAEGCQPGQQDITVGVSPLAEPSVPGAGQRQVRGSFVGGVYRAGEQPLAHQFGDQSADRVVGQGQGGRHVTHPGGPSSGDELSHGLQHLHLRHRQQHRTGRGAGTNRAPQLAPQLDQPVRETGRHDAARTRGAAGRGLPLLAGRGGGHDP
jgi:hypothetical protein